MELVQLAARATDLDHAAEYYTALLERPPLARFDSPGMLFFDLGEGVRLLLSAESAPATFYLKVENVHETLERIEEFAEVVSRPHMIFVHENDALGPIDNEEWQAFLRDPFGNTVGLVAFQKR